jgi:hypothetical protein
VPDRPGSPVTTSNEATEQFVDFTLEILKRLEMRPGLKSLCHAKD